MVQGVGNADVAQQRAGYERVDWLHQAPRLQGLPAVEQHLVGAVVHELNLAGLDPYDFPHSVAQVYRILARRPESFRQDGIRFRPRERGVLDGPEDEGEQHVGAVNVQPAGQPGLEAVGLDSFQRFRPLIEIHRGGEIFSVRVRVKLPHVAQLIDDRLGDANPLRRHRQVPVEEYQTDSRVNVSNDEVHRRGRLRQGDDSLADGRAVRDVLDHARVRFRILHVHYTGGWISGTGNGRELPHCRLGGTR